MNTVQSQIEQPATEERTTAQVFQSLLDHVSQDLKSFENPGLVMDDPEFYTRMEAKADYAREVLSLLQDALSSSHS